MIVVGGNVFSGISSGRERRSSAKLRKGEETEESRAPVGSQRYTRVNTATGTVNPTLVSSFTPNAA